MNQAEAQTEIVSIGPYFFLRADDHIFRVDKIVSIIPHHNVAGSSMVWLSGVMKPIMIECETESVMEALRYNESKQQTT